MVSTRHTLFNSDSDLDSIRNSCDVFLNFHFQMCLARVSSNWWTSTNMLPFFSTAPLTRTPKRFTKCFQFFSAMKKWWAMQCKETPCLCISCVYMYISQFSMLGLILYIFILSYCYRSSLRWEKWRLVI